MPKSRPYEPFTYDATLSIRENALRALYVHMNTQKAGDPTSDPYDFEWDVIRREPLLDADRNATYALAILELEERPELAVQRDYTRVDLSMEFHVLLGNQETPAEKYNLILTNLKRRVRSENRLAGLNGGSALVRDIAFVGDASEIDSWLDGAIAGSVFWTVILKQSVDDPRKVVRQF